MSKYPQQFKFLTAKWEQLLSLPTWYLTVIPDIQAFTEAIGREPLEIQEACKARLYDFFERHLKAGDIALGNDSGSMDVDRKPIDTVVIHHTSNPPGLQPDRLSAIELMRLYGPYFANPSSQEDRHLKGQPAYSGHVRDGKQVFWPYHWIIRGNGRAERLLYDAEIGWQAGNWDINRQSIAIALDNDYEWDRPSSAEIGAIVAIIRTHYRQVSPERVLGHGEVTGKTACPSNLFLDGAKGKGWKDDLISLLNKRTDS